MKNLIYILILMTIMSYGCHRGGDHISLNTINTRNTFRFEAMYPEKKTAKLEKYLDSVLHNDLPLDENIDLFVNIGSAEKFNLQAKKGWLTITFDKKNSSLAGYYKVKRLTEGIGKEIKEK
ncbi:hypothetical protein [Pedobacter rhizosphaerae]|uniref:Lipoprotein n=1 Tax=Pedobacter rhizosphaerae TaxID=390241 RepID=A0A1H9L6T9_9SPHI|nr:hypothetical protein [Pedobacter rhizosphaerae]SER06867.1 hypothetical protein SAMN04488023_1048 [Pedobacter rhizosphaerae]